MARNVVRSSAAEASLVGGLMLAGSVPPTIAFLREDDFEDPRAQAIFCAMVACTSRGQSLDYAVVAAELERVGALQLVGGMNGISKICGASSTSGAVEHDARAIQEAARYRRVARAAKDVEQLAREGKDTTAAMASLVGATQADPRRPVPGLLGLDMMLMSNVDALPVAWLWPGRIPLGAITLLIGDPGLGKSTISLDIAARVSRGRPWPLHVEGCAAGGVVLLGAEDSLEHVVRPRLDVLDADPTRIAALRAVFDKRRRPVSLETDLRAVEEALDHVEAKLLIIDPLSAYLGKNVNAWRDDDVRRVMDPLADLTARKGIAALGLVHLTKASDRAALYRSQGSIAFVAAARSVLALATDPDEPDHKTRRMLLHVKCNLGLLSDALALDVTPPLTWGEERQVTAEEGLAPRRAHRADPGTKAKACELVILDVVTSAGGLVTVPEGRKHVLERMPGVSDSTIDRARKSAGVISIHPTVVGGAYFWSLPVPPSGGTRTGETTAAAPSPAYGRDVPSRQTENGRRDEPTASLHPPRGLSPVPSTSVPPAIDLGAAVLDRLNGHARLADVVADEVTSATGAARDDVLRAGDALERAGRIVVGSMPTGRADDVATTWMATDAGDDAGPQLTLQLTRRET
jgi:hypothetical protein